MRSKFLETENNIKTRLHTILNEQNSFNKGEAREFEDKFIEDEEESERFCFVQFWRHSAYGHYEVFNGIYYV